MSDQVTPPRVRISGTQDAKGLFKIEATGEGPSVEESQQLFAGALKAAVEEVHKAGFKLVSDQE